MLIHQKMADAKIIEADIANTHKICYIGITKGTTAPLQGVGQYMKQNYHLFHSPKFTRVVFLCLSPGFKKRYLRLLKIKVSNAIMNIPKAIKSLKSRFIRTTSHLCRMEGQRPCSDTIVPYHHGNISHFFMQLFFPWFQARNIFFPVAKFDKNVYDKSNMDQ